jgi:hypothetical protein
MTRNIQTRTKVKANKKHQEVAFDVVAGSLSVTSP